MKIMISLFKLRVIYILVKKIDHRIDLLLKMNLILKIQMAYHTDREHLGEPPLHSTWPSFFPLDR